MPQYVMPHFHGPSFCNSKFCRTVLIIANKITMKYTILACFISNQNTVLQSNYSVPLPKRQVQRINDARRGVLNKCYHHLFQIKNNPNQICWLMEPCKRLVEDTQYETFQIFLDRKQYRPDVIKFYETIYGTDYVSAGGEQITKV